MKHVSISRRKDYPNLDNTVIVSRIFLDKNAARPDVLMVKKILEIIVKQKIVYLFLSHGTLFNPTFEKTWGANFFPRDIP